MLAVLCTQQRWVRVVPNTCGKAFQTPSAPFDADVLAWLQEKGKGYQASVFGQPL